MTAARGIGAALGVAADHLLGEPPALHPVAGFGRLMGRLERRVWADDRRAGAVFAAAGVAVGASAGLGLARLGRRAGRMGPGAATALAVAVAVAGRALGDTAGGLAGALAGGDLEGARDRLPSLCGRDPGGLDEKELARAVVESVAENTVDAVVAPLWWGVVGGPAGTLGYRAVNTLDAMVGHRSARYARFGWAAARLDDLANLVPARLTALAVVVCRPSAAPAVARAVLGGARSHPSPNAGVAEAAFAGALGVRLGGPLHYGGRLEVRPALGDGRSCTPADIDEAVRLSGQVTALAGAMAALAGLLGRRSRR